MPKIAKGRRVQNDKVHVIAYNGKESLLMLLEEAETTFCNVLEEAARQGWLPDNFVDKHEEELAYLVQKYDIPHDER